MAKVISYNCNSIRNNSEIVKSFFGTSDIVFLQEIMLEKRDLDILNDFNPNFKHVAYVKDRECEGICEGRPSGGVAIFWRANLSPSLVPIFVDDSIIGIAIETDRGKILMLNVYLPCDLQTSNSIDKYKQSLATLEVIIREQNINQVVLVGDFNADPSKGRFWKLLQDFNQSMCLVALDEQFPDGTFTYLCPSKSSTSWLDHIVCTRKIADNIKDISVDYEKALYDHFPIYFTLDVVINVPNYTVRAQSDHKFVNWKKVNDNDK